MISLLALLAPLQDEVTRSAAAVEMELFGDYSLADPWFLALLPLVLAVVLWGRSRRGRSAGRVSVLPGGDLPKSLRQRMTWVPPFLQAVALVLCVIALARPLRGNVEENTVSEGVDIALLLDRSSSMSLPDLSESEDRIQSRLDVVKEVVEDFAVRRMTDREGNSDYVALITFAYYPQILCPFTLDVNALTNFLRTTRTVEGGTPEDGTAIGIALAKAVAVLRDSKAKSKVIVLLTDGENGIDDITPMEAAEMAAAEGIRVYTILAARYVYKRGFTGVARPTSDKPDTHELEAIAETTGGRFWRARQRDELEKVYDEIEQLERTPREDRRYVETFDLYPWFLEPALGLYLLAWLLSSTWARRLA
jgi:Ca-activated chloride channel family protein